MVDGDKFLNGKKDVSSESSSDADREGPGKPSEGTLLSKDAVKKALDVAQSVGARGELRHFGAFGLGNLDDSISLYEYIDEAEKRSRSLFESTFSDEKRPVEDLDVLNIAAEFGRPDEASEEGDDDFSDMSLSGAFLPEDTRDLKIPPASPQHSFATEKESALGIPLLDTDDSLFVHSEIHVDFDGMEIDGRKKKNGRLEDVRLWKILFSTFNGKFRGRCVLDTPAERRIVFINDGEVLSASSSEHQNDLLSFMLREGRFSEDAEMSIRREMPRSSGIYQLRKLLIKKSWMPLAKINQAERLYYESLISEAMEWSYGDWRLEPSAEIPALPVAPIETPILSLIFRGCIAAFDKEEICRVVSESSVLVPCDTARYQIDESMLSALESKVVAAWDGTATLGNSASGVLGTDAACRLAASLVQLGYFNVVEYASSTSAQSSSDADARLLSLPVFGKEETASLPEKEALKRQLALKIEKVNNGTYFEILDIDPFDEDADVASAKKRLSELFDVQRFWAAGVSGHEDEIYLVRRIIDEAFVVLGEPKRRERYRRAVQDEMTED